MDKKIAFAEMNHGRWIVICPHCLREDGIISAVEIKNVMEFICPEEYPNIMATALVASPRQHGHWISVPDEILREETIKQAIREGNNYEVQFPSDAQEIEAALRKRPRHARNWWPETTVAELKSENERMIKNA